MICNLLDGWRLNSNQNFIDLYYSYMHQMLVHIIWIAFINGIQTGVQPIVFGSIVFTITIVAELN